RAANGPFWWIQFLGQGTRLAILSHDDSLREFDLRTGLEIRMLRPPGRPGAIAFSPDERWCLTAGRGGAGSLRDLIADREMKVSLGTDSEVWLDCLRFSPDGQQFAAICANTVVKVWETATLRTNASFTGFLQSIHSLAFSPDGTRLAASSDG